MLQSKACLKQPACRFSRALLLIFCFSSVYAADLPVPAASPLLQQPAALAHPNSGVLPADQAFVLAAVAEADFSIVLHWNIHANHYLYRDTLQISRADGMAISPVLPPAVEVTDEFFGTTAVYFDRLQLTLPAALTGARAGSTTELLLQYQGCAKDLYCYPPQQLTVSLSFPD